MVAARSLSPPSLLHLQLYLLAHRLHLSLLVIHFFYFFCSYLYKVKIFLSFPTLLSIPTPHPPLEPYWGDLEHEIKILASDITEYFQPKKIHSAIKIKGHLEGRLTFKTLHYH